MKSITKFITKLFKRPEPVIIPRPMVIPNDLEEAVRELHIAFNPSEKREFGNFSPLEPGLSLHLTGGMAMRNNWKLWEPDTPLSSWFRKHKIWHPDDMSAIIYRAFWSSINNQPFDLEKEKTCYIIYWKRKGKGFDGVDLQETSGKRESREYTFNTSELNNLITRKLKTIPLPREIVEKNDNCKND